MAFPEVGAGELPCWGGTQRLTRAGGVALALRMLVVGEAIDADATRAQRHRVPGRRSGAAVGASSPTRLAAGAPRAQAAAREAVHRGRDLTMADGHRLESDLNLLLSTTADRAEGIAAFFEKRPPRVPGRMSARPSSREPGVAVARRAGERALPTSLGVAGCSDADPRARRSACSRPPLLLRAADGWVHPGPPTAWADFAAWWRRSAHGPGEPSRRRCLGRGGRRRGGGVDAPGGGGAPRAGGAPTRVLSSSGATRRRRCSVVVLGSAWAAPLAGRALAELGADVVRVDAPGPARSVPAARRARARPGASSRSTSATPPTATPVREPARRADLARRRHHTACARATSGSTTSAARASSARRRVRATSDRPGYGLAAEARGGWAARHDPPRLGRVVGGRSGRRSARGAASSVDVLHAGRDRRTRACVAGRRGRAPARAGARAVADDRLHVAHARARDRDRVRPPADQHLRRRHPRRALRGAHRRSSPIPDVRVVAVHRRPAITSPPAPTSRSSAPRPRCSPMRDARWGRDVWGLLAGGPGADDRVDARQRGRVRLRARAAVRLPHRGRRLRGGAARGADRHDPGGRRERRRLPRVAGTSARWRRCSPASASRPPTRSRVASSTRWCRVPSSRARTDELVAADRRPTPAAVRAAKALGRGLRSTCRSPPGWRARPTSRLVAGRASYVVASADAYAAKVSSGRSLPARSRGVRPAPPPRALDDAERAVRPRLTEPASAATG